MKKFEFKQIGLDEFELVNLQKNESISFKRTIEIGKTIQNMDADARYEMIKYMQQKGVKREDMIIKTIKEDGSIEYDESYFKEFESGFLQAAQTKMINEIHLIAFNKSMIDIFIWLDMLEDQENAMLYGIKLREILLGANVGEIPSGVNEQPSKENI